MAITRSFRTRILLLLLAVGLVPLGLLGLWLNREVARSGRDLLGERLERAVDDAANAIGTRWLGQRSRMLDLSESPFAMAVLSDPRTLESEPSGIPDPGLPSTVLAAVLKDPEGEVRWRYRKVLENTDPWAMGGPLPLVVSFPVRANAGGTRMGTLDVEVTLDQLIGAGADRRSAPGMILGVLERRTRAPLTPLPFDPSLLERERFDWGGESWITARREIREPPVEIVAASPLSPFTGPFEEASERGLWLLVAVTALALVAGGMFTGRLTASLERLARAAEGVASGDLERRVDVAGNDEVGRLARAFNAMTESLRRTLGRLAERESVAAVGEFAASLAHEIRNPLSAILVDLERVEEGLPRDSTLRRPQRRALRQVARLNRAVTGTLRLAGSGRTVREPLDLGGPLSAAVDVARPALERRGSRLELPDHGWTGIPIRGDSARLEELFLNLLLNAAQALEDGGTVRLDVSRAGADVVVSIHDNGRGIPERERARIFEPFYSTRREGTGLGLPTALCVARAHGGELEIESEEGAGTTVRVRLPVMHGETGNGPSR